MVNKIINETVWTKKNYAGKLWTLGGVKVVEYYFFLSKIGATSSRIEKLCLKKEEKEREQS